MCLHPDTLRDQTACAKPDLSLMRQRGFTLLELIVSIAILAIMAGAAYAGWFNVTRIAQSSERVVEQYDSIERTFYWLQEDFEQIVKRDVVDELGGKRKSIEVSQAGEYVVQVTRGGWTNPALLQMPPRSDLQRVSYILDDESQLMRRYWYHVDRFDSSAFSERRLLDNVNSFTFRFFDLGGSWHNTWPPADNISEEEFDELPAAVEATVEVENVGTISRLFVLPY